jgi:hypothetical protein
MNHRFEITGKRSNIHGRSVGRVLLAVAFAYIGVYLVSPDHVINPSTHPPWAHFAAGALFLSAAVLLPFRRNTGSAPSAHSACWSPLW